MSFLNPTLFAAAVACVTIPIVIHFLMRRRRKPLEFAAMRFLMEALRRQQRRLRFEQLLLLLTRCALVAILAMAVGRLILGDAAADAGGPRSIVIVIDNSLTSQVRAGGAGDGGGGSDGVSGVELDEHKARALAMVAGLDAARGDRAAVVTLAGPAEAPIPRATFELGAVRAAIEAIKPAASAADVRGGMALARAALQSEDENSAQRRVVLLSGLRLGTIDPRVVGARGVTRVEGRAESAQDGARVGTPAPASAAGEGNGGRGGGFERLVVREPTGVEAGNVSIVAVEPLRRVLLRGSAGIGGAARREAVRVTLRRSGAGLGSEGLTGLRVAVLSARDLSPLASGVRGAEEPIAVRWAAGQEEQSVIATVGLPSGAGGGEGLEGGGGGVVLEARIDGDAMGGDAIAGDNVFRRPLPTREALRVGIVGAGSQIAGRPGEYGAADWMALALSPISGLSSGSLSLTGQDEDVRVIRLDAARLEAADLAGLDAVLVVAPEALPAEGARDAWEMLRGFADGGGFVLVVPPAGETVHRWMDGLTGAFALPWSVGREAEAVLPPTAVVTGAGAVGAGSPIAALDAELAELLKPVFVMKRLKLETKGAGSVLLASADGWPVLVMARSGEGAESAEEGAVGTVGAGGGGERDATRAAGGRGLIALMTSAPDLAWTTLPAMPLMLPLMQELVRQGVGRALGDGTVLAGEVPAEVPLVVEWALVRGAEEDAAPKSISVGGRGVGGSGSGGRESAVAVRGTAVYRGVDSAGAVRAVLAFNADPAGSRTDVQAKEQLAEAMAGLAGDAEVEWVSGAEDGEGDGAMMAGGTGGDGTGRGEGGPRTPPVDGPLLVMAMVLALAEVVMARYFSHAWAGPRGGGGGMGLGGARVGA